MDNLKEEWKEIPDFPDYQVSNFGNVYSKKSKKNLRPDKHPNGGHLRVTLFKNKKRFRKWVHVLVLETFISKRPNPNSVCRHLDGNPENNHVENLSWGSLIDNILDRVNNPNDDGIKLNKEDIIKIKTMLIEGMRPVDISKKLEISEFIISNIKSGHNWKDIGEDLSNYNLKKKRPPLSIDIVRKIKQRISEGKSNLEIANEFGITRNCVSCIRCGFRYNWVK